MEKKSAVEWLWNELIKRNLIRDVVYSDGFKISDLYDQALQMDKQQSDLSDKELNKAAVKEYENVWDEKLFPNHTDKDIWMNGFNAGAKWYREQLKQRK